jgi:hypothetical protein
VSTMLWQSSTNDSKNTGEDAVVTSKTIPCIACKEDIKIGAIRCVHCDSLQDWRRHFNIGTVVLSLLIALFSVITTLYQVIISNIKPKYSEVYFEILKAEDQSLQIAAINKGNLAAIFRKATLITIRDGKKKEKRNLLYREATETKHDKQITPIIEPSKVTIFELLSEINGIPAELPKQTLEKEMCEYSIQIDIATFGKEKKSERRDTTKYPCLKSK